MLLSAFAIRIVRGVHAIGAGLFPFEDEERAHEELGRADLE